MAVVSESRLVTLDREADVFVARECARAMALQAGLDGYVASNIEIAVSELSTNVLRYGKRGQALLRIDSRGFEIEIHDEGPGFGAASPRTDGLGIGLTGAARLLDELDLENSTTGGRAIGRKALPAARPEETTWMAASASSTLGPEVLGGDAYVVENVASGLLVAMVDGLGHGTPAHIAASAVVDHVRSHRDGTPAELVAGAHSAARDTRGAVALFALIEPEPGRLRWAGVGDVTGMLLPSGIRLLPQTGSLGVRVPPVVREEEASWTADSSLVLWTDGCHPPTPDRVPDPSRLRDWVEDALIANRKGTDDALVLAVRHS